MRHSALLLLLLMAALPLGCNAPDPPLNVLFIAVDDLNNDLGAYGHPLVQSPNIDRLAARGVRFDRAYAQYPVCNPSRSSFLTGLYPDQTGVTRNSDQFREHVPDVLTLPQWFRQHGYFVARVGKIFHYGVPMMIGTNGVDDSLSWEERVNPRGIDREVHDQIHTLVPGQFGGTLSWLSIESQDEEHTDGIGATEAIRLLESNHPDATGRPFFLAVGFYRPHTPFVAPAHHFERYPREDIEPVLERPGDRDDIPVAALADRPHQRELTMDQRKEIIQAYYASVSLMDAQVGRLLQALDRLDLAERTLIVFVSDHGYHLGHHGLWQKGDLFEGSARVPLIVAHPDGRSAGTSTEALTELVDLYPTIVELAGLDMPPHLQGRSLVPNISDPVAPGRSSALTEAWSRAARMHGDAVPDVPILGYSIRTPRFRYTEWAKGAYGVELYDYLDDPDEFTNLALDPAFADTLEAMSARLAQRTSAAGASH